jgi:hypothetical protein
MKFLAFGRSIFDASAKGAGEKNVTPLQGYH